MMKITEFKEECLICGKRDGLKHVKRDHGLTQKQYYDKVYKTEDEGYCVKCGIETNFNQNVLLGVTHIGYNKLCKKCGCGVTLEKCVIRHGEELGRETWNNYCTRQAEVNTFEYKQKKYNWTKEQFDEYNKSRSVTLENCVKRHGEEVGSKIFKDYCEKQKDAGTSLEYFKNKLGDIEGEKKYKELNLQKALTLENFIRKYGEELGKQKHNEYYTNRQYAKFHFSKTSQELFVNVYEQLEDNSDIFFHILNSEYGVHNPIADRFHYYDFVDLKYKKVIEYNGLMFHAKSEDDPNFFNCFDSTITSKISYNNDKIKLDFIKSLGFDLLVIWEDEYNNDKELQVKRCLEFLRS